MKIGYKLLAISLFLLMLGNYLPAQAQTENVEPDKRWSIGITVGIPEKAINLYSTYEEPLNNGYYFDEGRHKHNNIATGIKINYAVKKKNSIALRYSFNINKTYGYRVISTGGIPNKSRYDTINGYQYIHSFYLGYEMQTIIGKKIILGFTPSLLYNKYGKAYMRWKSDDYINNYFYDGGSKSDGGFGIGISANPSIIYILSKNILVGINLPLSLTYVHIGNSYLLHSINTQTNTVVQNETNYAESTYLPYFSFTPYFSVQYLF